MNNMKAVLLAVAGLLSIIGVQAQSKCGATYKEELYPPKCLSNPRVQLPYYPDAGKFYNCSTGTPVLTSCANGKVFCNAFQDCTECANYIPAVECNGLNWGLPCAPISNESPTVTTPGAVTTAAPVTTSSPTTRTTTTRTTTTRTTSSSSTASITTPSIVVTPPSETGGTTIYVEPPPSPNDPNVPMPPTPAPTAGTIQPFPPTVA